jgi:hypothetical protein
MSTSLFHRAFEEMTVYRMQLRTATSANKGTHDAVWTELNETAHKFYQGSVLNYDVIDADIKKLMEIRYIKFRAKRDDGPCFSKVELLINNSSLLIYYTLIVSSYGICFEKK